VTDQRPEVAPLPRRQPQGAPAPLPKRGQPGGAAQSQEGGTVLPRRTTHVRRAGRHRSPHRLSVATDAPALVIAVPSASTSGDRELAEHIAQSASVSCPGVDIQFAFLGDPNPALPFEPEAEPANGAESAPRAVVVPLLAGPHPAIDAAIDGLIARASVPVMLAGHLGPHPLLAGALHDRLSDAGLARASRARGISIAVGTSGVLLVADRGPQATTDAGVTAVLLAARLAMPVAPASIDDPNSVHDALARLREAGANRLSIAPCVIGPESDPAPFSRLSSALGAPLAPPLGAHPAIAQLIAVRYGEALARISVASR
jgi:hypothetical protein